jgi:hypothetical protein
MFILSPAIFLQKEGGSNSLTFGGFADHAGSRFEGQSLGNNRYLPIQEPHYPSSLNSGEGAKSVRRA